MSYEQTASLGHAYLVSGISPEHGLLCRASLGCRFCSKVKADTQDAMTAAAKVRDAHELSEHDYVHVRDGTPVAGIAFSYMGRSTMNRRKKT